MLDYIAAITMNTSLSIFGGIPGQSGIGYDAAGNRGGFTGTLPAYNASDFNFSHVMAYTYDARDELTEESSTATSGNTNTVDVYDQTFGFDLAYNRTAFEDVPPSSPFSYLFNTDNQNSGTGFTYDGSGNPTQYNSSASTYAYDPEQRLTGIGGTFTAHYDGDGMRDYTIVGSTTTYFLYDGASPVLEETFVASPAATTIQIANGMADGWRERYAATSSGFNAYGFDPQGSLNVEDSSFNTTQPAQNVYVFDGYGNRLVGERISNGSTTAFNIDPVQFGGQYGYYTDTSTGEVQLTHRYYDPSTGHFLNRDPIGYNGGQNLYAFCGNNPINRNDPSGHGEAASPGSGNSHFGLHPLIDARSPTADEKKQILGAISIIAGSTEPNAHKIASTLSTMLKTGHISIDPTSDETTSVSGKERGYVTVVWWTTSSNVTINLHADEFRNNYGGETPVSQEISNLRLSSTLFHEYQHAQVEPTLWEIYHVGPISTAAEDHAYGPQWQYLLRLRKQNANNPNKYIRETIDDMIDTDILPEDQR